ncbi:MAG: family 78 glycoside hydrolase catalytic domain [Verrucomicrobiota bacterium JB024]|nr:family 78 glycoside hydrolase catalytic domain [Verrucomicrobiota bacterium JB024]
MGIDVRRPRLSWRIEAAEPSFVQVGYRVWVATSPELLDQDEGDLWDSGQVESSASACVCYAGEVLSSRQRCYWKVRLWSGQGELESTIGSWEMALLEPQDWEAQWIGYPPGADGGALYVRRAFTLDGTVASARVYVSGLGYYELRLNGQKVGDHVLDPAWTAYDKRVLYCVYDVSEQLLSGRNVIGAIVGNGWYGMPKLRLQLEITYRDGRTIRVCSQGGHTAAPDTWQVARGPLRHNSVYGGEEYDATLEGPGWDQPENDKRGPGLDFVVAIPVDAPAGIMSAQMLEPIKVAERFPAIAWTEVEPGVYVFDAGKNLAGWAALCVQGPRGQRVTLRYAEGIGPNGKLARGTLRRAAARDTYILRGQGVERWEPRFTYHGFRYVEVEGLPEAPGIDTLTICAVRSSLRRRGFFACSDDLLNRIEQMVIRTEESNLHGVPTDCPQRDERLGWLNDMTVRTEEVVYHFGMERFLEKWCADVADTQCVKTGSITDTAPFAWGKRPADPVSASFLLVPWLSYLHYGCDRLIRRHFSQMERWVEFMAAQCEDGVLAYSSWGDWAPPEAFALKDSIGAGAVSRYTPGALVSTAYLCYQVRLLARMAEVIGREEDARRWHRFAREIGEDFHANFWNEAIGGYGSGNQACNALALYMELVPGELRARVARSLADNVAEHGYHLTTGNLCTKYLLEVLSDTGYVDAAFRIATQSSYPSWGYMLAHGATTLWERWENKTDGEMNSHNHPMLGSISAWFFQYLAGIRPEVTAPGFKRFTVTPYVPAGLDNVQASYECPYGLIKVEWVREGDVFTLELEVPANTHAHVRVPVICAGAICTAIRMDGTQQRLPSTERHSDGVIFHVDGGCYRFRIGPDASVCDTATGVSGSLLSKVD